MKKTLLLAGSVLSALLLANSARADIATVTLGGLSQTYDGTAKTVTVTTDPADLTVDVTYNGDSSAPTNAGSYTVVATVDDPTYAGGATNTLVISKASATVAISNINKTYDGSPLVPTVTTTPPGLGLNVYYLYTGLVGPQPAPTNPGTYSVVAQVQDANYQGQSSSFIQIFKAPATVTVSALEQTYDGTEKTVTVATDPPGLAVVVTYDGITNAPVDAGSYNVVASIKDPIYGGNATDTLNIDQAQAQITLGGLAQDFDGTPKGITVTTSPSGLAYIVLYGEELSDTPPVDIGSYPVEVVIDDPNYTGVVDDTLVISSGSCPPITINAPVTLHTIGDSISAFAATGGTGPYHYAITDGATPTGLTLNDDGTFTGKAYPIGTNTFRVLATDSNGCPGSTLCTIIVVPRNNSETNAPVLVVQTPPDKSVQSNPAITVSGTAKDSAGKIKTGTALVLYSLNGAASQAASTANNFSNWTTSLTLQPGWNTLVVTAVDYCGNTSMATRTYLCSASTNVAGKYNGLFYETNSSGLPAVAEQSAGFVTMKAQLNGKYTGKIYIAGTNYPLSGQFDLSGDSSTTVSRGADPQLSVALHLDWSGVTKQITGTVACVGEGWSAPLLAHLSVFGAKNPHAPSRYTMVIEPGSDAPTNSPGGFGYGLVAINAAGNIGLQGSLADSTPIKQTVPISKDGRWPLYVDLYKHHGLLEGWLDFSSGAPVGQVTWIKPANSGVTLTTYLGGFTNVVNVDGAVYANVIPAIAVSNGTLDITDASGLNVPLSLNAAVTATNTVVKLPPTTNTLSGSIAKTTGLANVKFRPSGGGAVNKTAVGVVLQSSNAVYGAFIGGDDGTGKTNTGAIYLH